MVESHLFAYYSVSSREQDLQHMFFGVGLIIFLVLTGYIYFRTRNLLETKKQRFLFTLVYGLLVFSFPGTEMLSHSSAWAWTEPLLPYGYLSLPFLLYLFLLILFLDMLRGVNRLLKIVPVESLKSRNARLVHLALLITIPGGIVLAGKMWNSHIQVNEYNIAIARPSSHLQELTIAVASDLHLREFTDPDLLSDFVEKVNGVKADLLLLPGDILEGDRQNDRTGEFAGQFRKIATTYGLFACPGNHEFHGRDDTLGFFRKSGITMLRDTVVKIDDAFWLAGRNDSRMRERKSIAELLSTIPRSLPVIVLDHKPTDLGNLSASGVDIVVSGHTHHGQLWPFNLITNRVYPLSWGHEVLGNTHAFVTSGLQVWGPPVRTAGESEIMVIRVGFK